MDPEQTFIRLQDRFSQVLTAKVRATLEYVYLFMAITLFSILVVMHANYVQQPGCSSELPGVEALDAQLVHIKITSAGLWSQNESEYSTEDVPELNVVTDKFELPNVSADDFALLASKISTAESSYSRVDDSVTKTETPETHNSFSMSAKETLKVAITHVNKKWHRRLSFIWRFILQVSQSTQKLWNITGICLNLDVPKWLRILHLDQANSYAVQWLEKKSNAFEPTYLYTMEKGYFLLPEEARLQHNIRTVNVTISAWHPCFGNRWQQLLINRVVGYDTILMNSILSSPGHGYLYNFQTNEFYNLSYAQEPPGGPAKFGDYLVTKCGVLMMSLFVFFTTTMSVSFTLRETQTRMLKFTVQLQHHARHHLPTFQLIFVHVIESLVFVPIMIGILFFLFEFYDDQLLAFMVLILVWLCELFTLISVRTPISMKFFPRFFLLYFLAFHIYFFSYTYGFSYLALSTTAAFMQHLILYFWNRFEVPALQRFMQNRRTQLQQHPDFHITSSTIFASTLHITRFNTRNPQGPPNVEVGTGLGVRPGPDQPAATGMPQPVGNRGVENPMQVAGEEGESGGNVGSMNSFSSMLLWILGGASYEGLNTFLSMFRDMRDQQGQQVYADNQRDGGEQTAEDVE
ncbi:Membralin-like protein At1g60995 [Linum perenne]